MDEQGSSEGKTLPANDTESKPVLVVVAKGLFGLLGLTWLVLGTWSLMRIDEMSIGAPPLILWIVDILMFINALLFIWVAWGIGRGNRLYFYFGLLLLAGNILLTFTDEFGTLDLITLVINILLLVLLIVGHRNFLET